MAKQNRRNVNVSERISVTEDSEKEKEAEYFKRLEQQASDIDQRMKERLERQEEEMGRLYLKSKEENSKIMEDMLGNFKTHLIQIVSNSQQETLTTVSVMVEGAVRGFEQRQREIEKGTEELRQEIREELRAVREEISCLRPKPEEVCTERRAKKSKPALRTVLRKGRVAPSQTGVGPHDRK